MLTIYKVWSVVVTSKGMYPGGVVVSFNNDDSKPRVCLEPLCEASRLSMMVEFTPSPAKETIAKEIGKWVTQLAHAARQCPNPPTSLDSIETPKAILWLLVNCLPTRRTDDLGKSHLVPVLADSLIFSTTLTC